MGSLILHLWKLKKIKKSLLKNNKKKHKNKDCYKNMKKMFSKEYFLMVKVQCGHLP